MRILWSSNYSAQSAYAQQSRMFVSRIAKTGHEVMVFELSSGVSRPYEQDGIPIIGVGQDSLGNDMIKHYVEQHRIDAVMTLVDVWRFTPDVWKDVPFYPWCVPGDTPIHTTDGQTLTIKEIVDNKLPVKVWGMKDNSLVEAEVTHYHSVDAKEAGELIEVKTGSGKTLLVTADNLVAVCVNNTLEWVRADCLKPQDMVYCINSISEQGVYNGNQPSNKGNRQLSGQSEADRMGLHSGDHRWRGDDFNIEGLQDQPMEIATYNIDSQYEREIDGLAITDNGYAYRQSPQNKAVQFCVGSRDENICCDLCNSGSGVQSLQYPETDTPISDYQETASRDSDGVHQLSADYFRDGLQPAIHRGGNQLLARDQKVELETVHETINRGRPEPRVYDLTTTVGNFFADEILIHNCPIDHHPIPPHVMPPLKAARRIVAMSKFGRDELAGANLNPLYCPLAFDPEIFHPRGDTKRGEIRRALNIGDDTFLACFVGVNDSTPNRKGIPEMLMAWKLFVMEHPNSVLYLHTLIHGNLPMNSIGGVKIDMLVNELGIPGHSLRVVDQNRYKAGVISQSEVADIMGASDVQVLLSRGEGYGVPLCEAQAVGTPVLTTRFAAQQELVQAGWLVDYESEWGWQDAILAKAGVLDAVDKFKMAYQARGNLALRKVAAAGIQGYAIDTVMRTHMLPTLDTIAEDVMERLAA